MNSKIFLVEKNRKKVISDLALRVVDNFLICSFLTLKGLNYNMLNKMFKDNLPGQFLMLQYVVSVVVPLQVPPFDSFSIFFLLLVFVPSPQLSVHSENADHVPQMQLNFHLISGHFSMLQDVVSLLVPWHDPPNSSSIIFCLVLVFVPSPQDLLHSENPVHWSQVQFTEKS